MKPCHFFTYRRLISDRQYTENTFDAEFIKSFRREFNLGQISDKNTHNLLITLFYSYMTGKSVSIWKKDFARLFGSVLNARKKQFFSMTGYTRQIWKGRMIKRYGQSRRYMARHEVMERILSIPLPTNPEFSNTELLEICDVACRTILLEEGASRRTAASATFFLITDPLKIYSRGAGCIPFRALGEAVTGTIHSKVLELRGLTEAEDVDFVRYAFYGHPQPPYWQILRGGYSDTSLSSMPHERRIAVNKAKTLWLFDQFREAA
jgi:hypothetical protein